MFKKLLMAAALVLSASSIYAQQPVSVPDGGDVTQGAKADAKSTATDTTPITAISILKEISFMEQTPASRAVTNAGTFAVQANPGTAANWGIGATGSAIPANGVLLGVTDSGTLRAVPGDATSGMWVNIKAGAGSGGTAITDNSAFTQSSTSETPAGCLYITSYTAATSGRSTAISCDSGGAINVNVKNANANGSAASASSSPVVIASDQAAVAIKAASASIASGAIASGAVASGAYASGSIGSGAIASGAIASGAVASGAYAAGAMAAQSFAVGAVPPVAGVLQHGTPQTLTTTASGAIISAVTSNYLYITSCQAMTTTTTGTIVDLTDGSAGTVIGFVPVPASAATSVAGSIVVFPSPLKVTTNGNGLYGANESSTTTKISCQGWSSTVSY